MMPYHTHYHQNRRSGGNGSRAKRIIQFSVLLAVVLWLAYQVKRSTDNVQQKVEYLRKDEDNFSDGRIELYLGRKGQPGYSGDVGARLKEYGKSDDSIGNSNGQEEAVTKEDGPLSDEGIGNKVEELASSQVRSIDNGQVSASHEEIGNNDGKSSSREETGNKVGESSLNEDFSTNEEESSSHNHLGAKEQESYSHEDISTNENELSSRKDLNNKEQEASSHEDTKQESSSNEDISTKEEKLSSDEITGNSEESSSTQEGNHNREESSSQEVVENKEEDPSQEMIMNKHNSGGQEVDHKTGDTNADPHNEEIQVATDRNEIEKSNETTEDVHEADQSLVGDHADSGKQSEESGEESGKSDSQHNGSHEEDGKAATDGNSADGQGEAIDIELKSSDADKIEQSNDELTITQNNSNLENDKHDEANDKIASEEEKSDEKDKTTKTEEYTYGKNEVTGMEEKSDQSGNENSTQHPEELSESDKGINGFHDENGVPDSDTRSSIEDGGTLEHNVISVATDTEDLKSSSSDREVDKNGIGTSTSDAVHSVENSDSSEANSLKDENNDNHILMPTDKENSTSEAVESRGEHAEEDEITNSNQVESDKTESESKPEVDKSETGAVAEDSQPENHDTPTDDAHPSSKLEDGDSDTSAPSPQTRDGHERREEF